MAIKRMDNVGIVVESLDAAISFFTELGLKLEGRAMVEGEWAGRVTGLGTQRVEIAMMVTPDGHSRLETLAISHPACSCRSPERPGERSRLPTRHVHCGRPRRDARPAPQAWRAARRRSGPVRRHRIGSATSAAPKDFSSGSPRSSAKAFLHEH